ncbi:RNA polymerase sigma factor [Patescibacteria group bacterium]|nr:MAG: RNA polymerase sigma factor [Patescibacteria group bacterium]
MVVSNSLQDKLLLFRIRLQRDPQAFGKLYDAYVNRIYRFVYFKIPLVEDAQDITSETFLRFWNQVQEGAPVTHVGAYLYRIARNLVADHYRTRQDALSIDAAPELEHLLLSDAKGLIKIEESLDIGKVLKALRLLKDEYREAIILRYVDELTTTEIAEALGKSPGNVRVLLHRSLDTLRTLLRTAPPSSRT